MHYRLAFKHQGIRHAKLCSTINPNLDLRELFSDYVMSFHPMIRLNELEEIILKSVKGSNYTYL